MGYDTTWYNGILKNPKWIGVQGHAVLAELPVQLHFLECMWVLPISLSLSRRIGSHGKACLYSVTVITVVVNGLLFVIYCLVESPHLWMISTKQHWATTIQSINRTGSCSLLLIPLASLPACNGFAFPCQDCSHALLSFAKVFIKGHTCPWRAIPLPLLRLFDSLAFAFRYI